MAVSVDTLWQMVDPVDPCRTIRNSRFKIRRPRGHCLIFKPPVVLQDEIVVEASLDTTIVYHSIPLGSGESRFGPLALFSKQCVGITGEC